MKPFNLNEFLANPSRKVVTRDGRHARIICTDANCEHPIVALIREEDNTELIFNFSQNGVFSNGEECQVDLFFATEMKEGWMNIYRYANDLQNSCIYDTKEEAELHTKILCNNYVATVKVTWDE